MKKLLTVLCAFFAMTSFATETLIFNYTLQTDTQEAPVHDLWAVYTEDFSGNEIAACEIEIIEDNKTHAKYEIIITNGTLYEEPIPFSVEISRTIQNDLTTASIGLAKTVDELVSAFSYGDGYVGENFIVASEKNFLAIMGGDFSKSIPTIKTGIINKITINEKTYATIKCHVVKSLMQ